MAPCSGADNNLAEDGTRSKKLFEWCDGPLVTSMREGHMLLIDEISLADDSVLERLNSVLEPGRLLVLAEKGGDSVDEIVGCDNFRIIATMNPGGDFGKKELSPALRNRFTEVWVPAVTNHEDLLQIVTHILTERFSFLAEHTLVFFDWLISNRLLSGALSLRDYISWGSFVAKLGGLMGPWVAWVHGACLTMVDALGTGSSSYLGDTAKIRQQCISRLLECMPESEREAIQQSGGVKDGASLDFFKYPDLGRWGSPPFTITYDAAVVGSGNEVIPFNLRAPTTASNTFRILRAMQLDKPILLEGSPGVGKTSIVTTIAKITGHKLIRLNLSEQTDIMDLFGSDLPVEGSVGEFAWRDGPLLRALKDNSWVVLDELNLATQSVLEGLNACLDHRGEIYVPELDRTFKCEPGNFRLFACQNPVHQGGGRKGLPKSFLNRFTRVYVDTLKEKDLLQILEHNYPAIDGDLLQKMVQFNNRVHSDVFVRHKYGRGCGDFNLRDVFRWCDLMVKYQSPGAWLPETHVSVVYLARMIKESDQFGLCEAFADVFDRKIPPFSARAQFLATPTHVHFGHATLERKSTSLRNHHDAKLELVGALMPAMESLLTALAMKWMVMLRGGCCAGKTSVARMAAQLSGNVLREFSMNSSVDTLELLGGFEQVDVNRDRNELVRDAGNYVHSCVEVLLLQSPSSTASALYSSWTNFKEKIRINNPDEANINSIDIDLLVSILRRAEKMTRELASDSSKNCMEICQRAEVIGSVGKNSKSGSFQWRDGMLIEALQSGDWLLIDNVNLCNASVLDRLNGLLEPNGTLIMGERGVIDGTVPEIVPHPNFRLILSLDPQNGDISRAMRNRGIEIHMDTLPLSTGKTIVETAGLSQQSVASSLGSWHAFAVQHLPLWQQKQLPIRILKNFAALIKELLDRGASLPNAIQIAVDQEYRASSALSADYFARNTVESAHDDIAGTLAHADNRVLQFYSLCLTTHPYLSPKTWPASFELGWMQTDSKFATVALEGALVLQAVRILRVLNIQSKRGQSDAVEFNESTAFYFSPSDLRQCVFPWLSVEGKGIGVPSPSPDLFAHSKFSELTVGVMNLLEALLFRFVKSATFEDWPLRKCWLERLPSACDTTEARALSAKAVEWITRLFDHSVMSTIRTCVVEMSQKLEMVHLNLEAYCWDFFAHGDTHKQFETACTSNPATCDQWTQYISAIRCMRIQSKRIWCQLTAEAADASDASIHSYTWLQQSQALQRGRVDESRLCHPAVQFLSLFMEGVDKYVDEVLSENNGLFAGLGYGEVAAATDNVIHHRNLFYDLCMDQATASSMPGEKMRIRYKWTIDALDTLAQLTGVAIGAHLQNVGNHLASALSDQKPDAQTAFDMGQHLWPCHTFRIQTIFDIYAEFLRIDGLCDTVRLVRKDSELDTLALGSTTRTSNVGLDMRRQFCDAIATLFALDESITHDNDPLDDLSMSVPRDSHQQLLRTLGPIPDDMECAVRKTANDVQLSELHTLHDYLFALEETRVLSSIMRSRRLKQDAANGELTYHFEVLADDIKKLVEGLQSSLSTRPPSDVASYRRLAWLLDLQEQGRANNMQVSSVVTELVGAWFQRTWAATYDDVLLTTARERRSRLDKEGAQALVGPVRREQCVVTCLVDSMIKFQHTKVVNFPSKQKQWAELVDFLDTHSASLSSFSNDLCERQMLVSMTISATLTIAELQDETIKAQVCASLLDWCGGPLAAEGTASVVPEALANSIVTVLLSDTAHALHPLLVKHLKPLLSLLSKDSPQSSDESEPVEGSRLMDMHDRGLCWVHLGQISLALVTPSSFVDHAAADLQQLSDIRDEIWDVDTTSACDKLGYLFLSQGDATTGKGGGAVARSLLTAKARALQKKVVLRPTPSQFNELQAEIVRCNMSLCSNDRIMEVAAGLSAAALGDGSQTSVGFLQQQESLLQSNLRQFCDRLQSNFPLYRDIVRPIVVARNQVALGLWLLSFVNEISRKDDTAAAMPATEQTLLAIARLPQYMPNNSSPIDSVSALVNADCLANLKAAMPVQWSLYMRAAVLHTALIRTRNHVFHTGHMSLESIYVLDTIFALYVEWWDGLEHKRLEKEAAEATMFKFRDKVHTAFDDEVEAEKEFNKMFPKYTDEFADMLTMEEREEMQDPTVCSGGTPKSVDKEDDEDERQGAINAETLDFIVSVHSAIWSSDLHVLGKLPKTAELPNMNDGDRIEEVASSFNTLGNAMETFFVDGSRSLDAELSGTFRFVTQLQCTESATSEGGKTSEASEKPANSRTGRLGTDKQYDFYKDANVAEVRIVLDVLTPLKVRLQELLQEFHEHPNLVQLLCITDRILHFAVQAPIIKFLYGIDLILSRAQDWERVAKKSISLITYLESITQLIIRWRKLELKRWPSILSNVQDKFNASVQRLWFSLYKILTGSPQYSADVPKEQANDEYLSRIFDAVDSAFQRAKLGTFTALLRLVHDFGCQTMAYADLDLTPSSSSSSVVAEADGAAVVNESGSTAGRVASFRHQVASLVLNLYEYYSQFSDKVVSTVTRRRLPLEKELKDYVKIARWKDTNYSALKSSAEKTHRKIHAIGRKYEAVLIESVTSLLEQCLTPSTSVRDESKDADDLQQPVQLQYNYLREEDDAGDASATDKTSTLAAPCVTLEAPNHYLLPDDAVASASLTDMIPDQLASLREHEGKLAYFCRLPGLLKNMQNTCFNRVFCSRTASNISRIDNLSLNIMNNVEWLQGWADAQKAKDKARAEAKEAGAGDEDGADGKPPIRWTDKRTNHRDRTKEKTMSVRVDMGDEDNDQEEEKVRDHHKHARVMKHKAFAELLKLLKKIGLSPVAVAVSDRSMNQAVKLPLVDVNPLAAYMKQSSSGPASYSQFSHTRMQKVADVWSKCEKYHFRVLGRMTTLRQVAITPNPEIRPENAQQCSGLAEHLLSVQLQQRRIMSEFLPGYAALLCLVNRSTNMVGGTEDAVADVCDSTTSQQTVTVLVEAAKWAVDGILALLAETRLVCGKDSAKLDGATAKKIEEAAQTLKLEVDMLYREIAISFGGQRPVASQHLIAGTASCSEGVVNLLGTMVQWAERDGSAALPTVCRQSVVLFVADARSRLDEANAKSGGAAAAVVDTATEAAEMDEDSPEAMAAFTASYNSIMSHLLSKVVAVGKVKSETDANLTKAANDKKIEADPDAMRAKSLVLLHKDLVAAFRALNLQSLNAKLQQLSTSVAAETSTDSAQSTALQAKLLRQLSPFLFQFLSLCDRLIAEFSELHRSICKLSLIVSGLFADILKRGFCGPVEEVEGDGEDQDGELDGTGMAEGDGSKDVSEEIEDEEQVLGNQDDKPEDDNDKDIEEEDNAIDMANEFDGELYDPEENEEDEKSDDDFDEDELDQQMGETDFDKSEQTEEQQLQESDDDGKDLDDDGMEGGTRFVCGRAAATVCICWLRNVKRPGSDAFYLFWDLDLLVFDVSVGRRRLGAAGLLSCWNTRLLTMSVFLTQRCFTMRTCAHSYSALLAPPLRVRM